ncbi:MAG: OmpA family protein [Alphaproteobacteria bacterium]|nr:OmpA family protein [Alphaproteobacteria bacterium]
MPVGTPPAAATGAAAPTRPAVLAVPPSQAGLRVESTDRGTRIVLPADPLFGSAPDTIAGGGDAMLAEAARLIAANHAREVVIAGHTDGVGRDDDNQALSERRARAVAAWLRAHVGRDPPRFVEQGYGRTRPVAPNHNPDGSDNPQGRAENRRIEIYLRG